MPPSTITNSTSTCQPLRTEATRSRQGLLGSTVAAICGEALMTRMPRMNTSVDSRPGSTPATSILPAETSVRAA